jgi:2-oxoglutarate dehydrogenase E2 component (dihydrolipoamide succinyltransferase)
MTDIRVPPLGDSITEATIARWTKKEGDPVGVGETVVELETDKINVEVPAQSAGILTLRLKDEGAIVGVGDVLGVMEAADDQPRQTQPAMRSPPPAQPPPAQPPPAQPPKPPPPPEPPHAEEFAGVHPDQFKPFSRVSSATPVAAALTIPPVWPPPPAPTAPPPVPTAPRASTPATPVQRATPYAPPPPTLRSIPSVPPDPWSRPTPPEPTTPLEPLAAAAPPATPELRVAPSARRYAEEHGIPLASVVGTGRGGVISKPDVMDYEDALRSGAISAQQPMELPGQLSPSRAEELLPKLFDTPPESFEAIEPPSPPLPPPPPPRAVSPPTPPPTEPRRPSAESPPPADLRPPPVLAGDARETREKMSTRRRRIAENLLQSHLNTARLTTFNEIDMTALMELRTRHKERVDQEHGVKLTFMPFFAKAAVNALRSYPMVNAQVDGDEIIYKHYVHLGVAVASEQGLVVPNIKDAHTKGVLAIGREMSALAKKAREVKLTMDDLTGGTFTITNGGVFGSLVSTPIINFPQVAILGLHKIQDRPMVVNGAIVARPMMYVALSYDHRIIDGQHAVLFLIRIKELIEDPTMMLIE